MSQEKMKVAIELTEEEATQLIKIINITVKNVGIEDGGEIANNAVYFLNKINQAFLQEQSRGR
jgi:capsular polysaccharide biosynthesis protein